LKIFLKMSVNRTKVVYHAVMQRKEPGRPRTDDAQIALVLRLDREGLTPRDMIERDDVTVGLTTIYNVLRIYNKKDGSPDRDAARTSPLSPDGMTGRNSQSTQRVPDIDPINITL